tara:strand:+ start:851 stop:1111 length:261 start_codon:yes stop_codon:yes gene_type:complete
MKEYLLKKLISGYKIKPSLRGLTLVALPFKYTKEKITVKFSDKSMVIDADTPLLHQETFPDKFGRDKNYTLYYYQWLLSDNQPKLF